MTKMPSEQKARDAPEKSKRQSLDNIVRKVKKPKLIKKTAAPKPPKP
jgi:hypothetical protein